MGWDGMEWNEGVRLLSHWMESRRLYPVYRYVIKIDKRRYTTRFVETRVRPYQEYNKRLRMNEWMIHR